MVATDSREALGGLPRRGREELAGERVAWHASPGAAGAKPSVMRRTWHTRSHLRVCVGAMCSLECVICLVIQAFEGKCGFSRKSHRTFGFASPVGKRSPGMGTAPRLPVPDEPPLGHRLCCRTCHNCSCVRRSALTAHG